MQRISEIIEIEESVNGRWAMADEQFTFNRVT